MRGFVKPLALALAALWASTTASAQSTDAPEAEPPPDAKIERYDDADELSLTPAKFLLFCTECDDERAALREELAAEERAHRDTHQRLETLEASFGKIRIDWVKIALFYGGYYGDSAVQFNKINSKIYDQLAINAVKKYQCEKFYPKVAGDCDPIVTTGWITYAEARSVICEQGYKGKDETAYLLADWYAYGEVYEKNPLFALTLIKKYLSNLEKDLAAPGANKEWLNGLREKANELYERIQSLKPNAARWPKIQAEAQACPRYDPEKAREHAH